MLKMFTTQLAGLFKRIEEKEEFPFEDGARLLAQGPVGDGKIYLLCVGEMKAVEFEAFEGSEPFKWAKRLKDVSEVTVADRVLLFSRYASDKTAVAIAEQLHERNIPFVAVSTALEEEETGVDHLADVHINLQLKKGLLPDEMGNRFGYPASMAGLFAYYGLKFTIEEILAEYEE
ncbi:DUF2529 domain-containing protein [Bacillus sp. JJ1764]|uniref:DUF2529 domain-containing protein n=1 Tax=Bacillus sp. JJ1764 TaxID=3122964 RepID=UPI003000551C